MIVEHFLIARGSSVDRDTQSLSVFEFIEQIQVQAPRFPVMLPVHAVVVIRRTKEEEGPLRGIYRLSVENPFGEEVLAQDIPVTFEQNHSRQRVRLNFPLPVGGSGIYYVAVENTNDSEDWSEIPLEVKAVEVAPPTIN